MTVTNRRRGKDRAQVMACKQGFSLTELLVVLGIAVILLAISVPIGKSLREGNRLLSCKAQMQQIGQALKMYQLDENGVPPFYIGTTDDPNADAPTGPGLMALYDTSYLTRELTLHCPRDVYTLTGHPDFLHSYQIKWDEDADGVGDVGGETELNKYSYLPFRGETNTADPYYHKQLQPGAVPGGGTVAVPYTDVDWHPADDTIVSWCPFHKETTIMNGEGQYLVLFWDGSVKKVAESIMQDSTAGEEAWKVNYDDVTD